MFWGPLVSQGGGGGEGVRAPDLKYTVIGRCFSGFRMKLRAWWSMDKLLFRAAEATCHLSAYSVSHH